MKIRNGFVSNSSSSSFIINVSDRFKTVKDVAEYILQTFISVDGTDEYYRDELDTLKNISNPDAPMYINSGDETYIRKHDDKFVIATTQNVEFNEFKSLNISDLSEEFLNFFEFEYDDEDYYEEDEDRTHKFKYLEDFDYYYKKFNDFLILKYNFLGRHEYITNCPHCGRIFSKGWLLNDGSKICDCNINKLIRKIKIRTINKKE